MSDDPIIASCLPRDSDSVSILEEAVDASYRSGRIRIIGDEPVPCKGLCRRVKAVECSNDPMTDPEPPPTILVEHTQTVTAEAIGVVRVVKETGEVPLTARVRSLGGARDKLVEPAPFCGDPDRSLSIF